MNIVTLHTAQSRLEIAPELGGSIVNFQVDINGETRPIIRQVNNPENVLDCGSFPLVPFSNRIKNGEFTWNDREIKLPINMPPTPHAIHGSGWQHAWQIVEQSDTKLVIEYRNQCRNGRSILWQQTFELEAHTLTVRSHTKQITKPCLPVGHILFHPNRTSKETAICRKCGQSMMSVYQQK